MYIEPEEYFTESARKILEEGETKPKVLFEHLSRCCMDFTNKDLSGFTIFDDGSYYETNYKPKTKNGNLFSSSKIKQLDEKNYQRKLIFTSEKLAETVNKFIEAHKDEINNLPKFINNSLVLDGNEDLVRIGDKSIPGCNIFYSTPYKINATAFKDLDSEHQKNEKALELLTTLYAQIQEVIDKDNS